MRGGRCTLRRHRGRSPLLHCLPSIAALAQTPVSAAVAAVKWVLQTLEPLPDGPSETLRAFFRVRSPRLPAALAPAAPLSMCRLTRFVRVLWRAGGDARPDRCHHRACDAAVTSRAAVAAQGDARQARRDEESPGGDEIADPPESHRAH